MTKDEFSRKYVDELRRKGRVLSELKGFPPARQWDELWDMYSDCYRRCETQHDKLAARTEAERLSSPPEVTAERDDLLAKWTVLGMATLRLLAAMKEARPPEAVPIKAPYVDFRGRSDFVSAHRQWDAAIKDIYFKLKSGGSIFSIEERFNEHTGRSFRGGRAKGAKGVVRLAVEIAVAERAVDNLDELFEFLKDPIEIEPGLFFTAVEVEPESAPPLKQTVHWTLTGPAGDDGERIVKKENRINGKKLKEYLATALHQ